MSTHRRDGVDGVEGLRSPYDDPESYDRVLDEFRFDVDFWIAEARASRGPVLEVACGSGRVLLRMLDAGLDVDGLDASAPMLERLRSKAGDRGTGLRVVETDMRDFTMPRRYAMAFIAFNGFAHCLTIEDQIRCLRCCREHLEPGGRFLLHMSYPGATYWSQPQGVPVLETDQPDPATGHRHLMYDTRTIDRVGQLQQSIVEIREVGPDGSVLRSDRFATSQRWVYRFELELLLRAAGFARWELFGGFAGEPFERDDQQMIARAWRD